MVLVQFTYDVTMWVACERSYMDIWRIKVEKYLFKLTGPPLSILHIVYEQWDCKYIAETNDKTMCWNLMQI